MPFFFLLKLFFPLLLHLFTIKIGWSARVYYRWDHNGKIRFVVECGSKTYDWRPGPYIYYMCFASLLSRIQSDRSKILVRTHTHTQICCVVIFCFSFCFGYFFLAPRITLCRRWIYVYANETRINGDVCMFDMKWHGYPTHNIHNFCFVLLLCGIWMWAIQ